MPPLDPGFFEGTGNPALTELVTAEISNKSSSAEAALDALKAADEQLIAFIILQLTPDNLKVDYGEFALRGILDERAFKIPCSKLWAAAEKGTMLNFKLPAAEDFGFTDGGLTSEYKPMNEVRHSFTTSADPKPMTTLTGDDVAAKNIGDFCLRIVCCLARSDPGGQIRIQTTVLLHPQSKAASLDMADSAREAGWPGIFIIETE